MCCVIYLWRGFNERFLILKEEREEVRRTLSLRLNPSQSPQRKWHDWPRNWPRNVRTNRWGRSDFIIVLSAVDYVLNWNYLMKSDSELHALFCWLWKHTPVDNWSQWCDRKVRLHCCHVKWRKINPQYIRKLKLHMHCVCQTSLWKDNNVEWYRNLWDFSGENWCFLMFAWEVLQFSLWL